MHIQHVIQLHPWDEPLKQQCRVLYKNYAFSVDRTENSKEFVEKNWHRVQEVIEKLPYDFLIDYMEISGNVLIIHSRKSPYNQIGDHPTFVFSILWVE
jgi:hypothetical protein